MAAEARRLKGTAGMALATAQEETGVQTGALTAALVGTGRGSGCGDQRRQGQ